MTAAADRSSGWSERGDRLEGAGLARRHRPGRHLHAGRHPRRDRHRRARGRQARAVREAAGQLGGRRPRRWSRAAERGSARCSRWSGSPTGASPRSSSPAAGARTAGSARSGTCARSTCRTGSPTPQAPLSWRLDKQKAGSGRARGHRRAHRRPRAVRHRASRSRASRRCSRRSCTERPVAGLLRRAARHGAGTATGPGDGRRRRDLPRPDVRRGTGDASRRPGSRGAARTRSGWRSTARAGSLAFDFEDMNVLHYFDATQPAAEARVSGGSSSPSPSTPTSAAWWPAGHGLGYEHAFTHQAVDLVTAIAEQPAAGAQLRRRARRAARAGRRRAVRRERQHVDPRATKES